MIKKRFILVIMIILTFSISLVSANEDLNNDREWDDEDYERWNAIHGDEYEEEADDVE